MKKTDIRELMSYLGKQNVKKHGKDHMREISRKGVLARRKKAKLLKKDIHS